MYMCVCGGLFLYLLKTFLLLEVYDKFCFYIVKNYYSKSIVNKSRLPPRCPPFPYQPNFYSICRGTRSLSCLWYNL